MKHLFLLVLVLFFFPSCKNNNKTTNNSLYNQIGGNEKIVLLVDHLVTILLNDKRISFLFEETNKADFSTLLIVQICHETGGMCKYKGLNMQEAHSGMNINKREFDNFVEDFIIAMDVSNIPFKHQNQLLNIFAPMRKEIIGQ